MKKERIEFRVNDDLRERYLQALKQARPGGLSITEHLTNEVVKFIEAQEKQSDTTKTAQ